MNKLTLAAAAAAALASAPALAADLGRAPARAPAAVMAVPPVMTWDGFYIGAQIGYQANRDHTIESVTATGVGTGFDVGTNSWGFIGGLHAGYNVQTGVIVWGIEGDIEASGVDGRFFAGGITPGSAMGAALNNGTDFNSRWQGSLRGRVGAAFGPALLYVTGGLAVADANYTYVNAGAGLSESFRSTEAGWTVGAGVEWAIQRNWSTRLEYRYTDLGSVTNVSTFAFPGNTYRHDPESHAVRLGVSYRFGGGPIVASY